MDRPEHLIDGQYRAIKLLGSGSFGDALLVKRIQDGSLFVLKYSKIMGRNDVVLLEAKNMLLTTSDHVVRCYRAWVESEDGRCYMLLEYCDGGDLENYLHLAYPFSESQLISMFAQLLMGLDHVHMKHLIHRDIKLQNLLLQRSTGVVKIGDFGLSKALQFTDEASGTRLGTPLYFSPEVVSGLDYTRKTDVWSMGVAFYQLMTNAFPFPATSVDEIYEYLGKKRAVHPCRLREGYYSESLGDLVMKMLTKSRTKRPTARELLALPIFDGVLSSWPWRSPRLKGASCLFVCRPRSSVNVRSQPSLKAERIGEYAYGDHLFVSSERLDNEGLTWYHVLYPLEGYCITATMNGQHLFQMVNDPTRCSPIATPRSGIRCLSDLGSVLGTGTLSPELMRTLQDELKEEERQKDCGIGEALRGCIASGDLGHMECPEADAAQLRKVDAMADGLFSRIPLPVDPMRAALAPTEEELAERRESEVLKEAVREQYMRQRAAKSAEEARIATAMKHYDVSGDEGVAHDSGGDTLSLDERTEVRQQIDAMKLQIARLEKFLNSQEGD